ncbi:MAG TPA: hypothetical protein V6D11_14785 [Waterburya sp.]|jgi:hypothetical protein
MNLPLVLDVAIGLIFIYLILSLLASEIQELITTLLQWRAVHLKRSIENLLMGEEGTPEETEKVKSIVATLYGNPLIENINQQSKEGVESLFRELTWQFGKIFRSMQKQESNIFGKTEQTQKEKRSGPSYIPAETFATTLLERLNIPKLTQQISAVNLIRFKEEEIKSEIIKAIRSENLKLNQGTREKLEIEFKRLVIRLDKITRNYELQKASLANSLKWMENEIKGYVISSVALFDNEEEGDSKEEFESEINSLQEEIFIDFDSLEKRLKAGLSEVIYELETGGRLYRQLRDGLTDQTSELYKKYEEIEGDIEELIGKLPTSVRKSLSALGRRAQINTVKVDQELKQFQKEVSNWFDRSMDRASGVYKRNAKGVAFLIGIFLAFAANADTLHIIDRLSKDTAVRTAITRYAGSAVSNCSTSELECIRNQVNQNIEALPIGRSSTNIVEQDKESQGWPVPRLKRILGWILSGFAISMGAPFWFELLSKIVNVRNTGPKPQSSTEDQS